MKKILLVDDEKGVVAMMKSYFEMSGYQVLTAYNGAEALRQAVHQPDIILLDINMPGMDGLTVCKKIRDYISCPILFLTARIETADKIKGFQVGADDYNQTTINNLTESQTKGVSGGPSAPYGRYGNIFLSQTEYDELQAEYPDRLERFIEEMSRYLAANGKSYQNYAAALRIWAGNDKKEAPKKGIPDYSCKEGESL